MGVDGGIGAVIWGVTVTGVTHRPNWATDILSSALWGSESTMIGNAMMIPEADQASIPTTAYGSSSSDTIRDIYRPWYTSKGVTSLTPGDNVNYTHSAFLYTNPGGYAGTSLMDAFAGFGEAAAQAAVSVHTGLKGSMTLNGYYDLYQYPDNALVELTSSSPTTAQSYEIVGKNGVQWNMYQMDSNSTRTTPF